MTLQRRSRRFSGALLASLVLLWLAAPAAFARDGQRRSERFDSHRDQRDQRDHRAHRGHRGHRGRDDGYRGRGGHARHRGHDDRYRGHPRSYARAAHHRDAYYCKPCNHRFRSRSAFHGHLHGHHHLPFLAIPFMVIYWASTWTYHG